MNKYVEDYLKGRDIKDYSPGYSASATLCVDDKVFLKTDINGELYHEYLGLKLLNNNGLAPRPIMYISDDKDYLFTEKQEGELAYEKYHGDELIQFLGRTMRDFHGRQLSLEGLEINEQRAIMGKTAAMLAYAKHNYRHGIYNPDMLTLFGKGTPDDVYAYIRDHIGDLVDDTIIHGDMNARNVFVVGDSYRFIDPYELGFTDHHIDLALLILAISIHTGEDAEEKLLNAYGTDHIDEKRLHLCKQISTFFYQ